MDRPGNPSSLRRGPETSPSSRGKQEMGELRREREPLDNVMRVNTPENISFQYEVVGPFRRMWAYILDILISLVGYWILIFVFWMVFAFVIYPLVNSMGLAPIFDELGGMLVGFVFIGQFLVFWFYGAFCETYFNGATLGKSILQLRVITVDGHAIDGTAATLRNFFRLIDMMPMVTLGALFEVEEFTGVALPTGMFGLLVMMLNRRYQRLGDLVANTVVVNEEKARLPNLAKFTDKRVPQLAEMIPDSFFVTPSLALAIADYVEHRSTLNYQRASEIASFLAVPLLERFRLPSDTDHDLLLCSLYYKVFVKQDLGGDESVAAKDFAAIGPSEENVINPYVP
ncbi:MAG: RDD family protein [Planctomycetota bacterium]